MTNATRPSDTPVESFLATVTPERRRVEAERVVSLFTHLLGAPAVMWGPSIVGWGSVHYRYASGREGDMAAVGFSPRKAQLTFYGFRDTHEGEALLGKLGTHTTGVGCVYVKRLEDVDLEVLEGLARIAFARGDFDARA